MTVQTTYAENISQALPGLPYDLTDHEAIGNTLEVSSARFGSALVAGSADNCCRLPDSADQLGAGASGLVFLGVSMREHVREDKPGVPLAAPIGVGETSYHDVGGTVSIKTSGRIFVLCEDGASRGDGVHFRHVAAAAEVLGAFLGATIAGQTQVIASAKWVTTVAAGEIGVIEINGPH